MPKSTLVDSRRRPTAEDAILKAAFEMIQSEGLAVVTVPAIAERAGVSRATIYKWWPNRAAIIMSALLREAPARMPYPARMTQRDIRAITLTTAREFRDSTGAMIKALVAEGQLDPATSEAFRSQYLTPRRAEGRAVVTSAIGAGEIVDADPWLVLDMIYGPLVFRLLLGHEEVSDEFAVSHADLVWECLKTDAQE